MKSLVNLIILSLISVFLFSACGSGLSSQASQYADILSEQLICDTHYSYTNGVIVSGTAKFEKRSVVATPDTSYTPARLKTLSLGDPLPTPLPIKNAEVAIYNSDRRIVQCGITDSNGYVKNISGGSLDIPNVPGTYILQIRSRSKKNYSDQNYYDISIKKDIYRNENYVLEQNIISDGSTATPVIIVAKARQTDSMEIEGGAFNILNSLQVAYDYIKSNTSSINTTCLSTRLNVFWKAGFNPIQYLYPNADPSTLSNTSYYLKTTKNLYITGGQLGDLSMSNTDHFDDFATIHEFGHFIEDHCGELVSPGGTHNVTFRIDPRLAWSEGWANYFSTQVMHSQLNLLLPNFNTELLNVSENYGWTFFFNSNGFSDSYQNMSNGEGWFIDFKKSGGSPGAWLSGPYIGQEYDKISASYPGEGHVREGTISRGLFKLSNSTCGSYCAQDPVTFAHIWAAYDKQTGIAQSSSPFFDSHTFLEKLKFDTNLTNLWDAGALNTPRLNRKSILSNEALQLKSDNTYLDVGTGNTAWSGYGKKLLTGFSCQLQIEPKPDSSINNGTSDPRYSNHFYTLDLDQLVGLTSLSVTFTKIAGSNLDHDLLVFKPGYLFNDDYTCSTAACTLFVPTRSVTSDVVLYNRTPALNLSTNYTKTINQFSTLLSGTDRKFILDIRGYTAGIGLSSSTKYSYSINSNLGVLCPQ